MTRLDLLFAIAAGLAAGWLTVAGTTAINAINIAPSVAPW